MNKVCFYPRSPFSPPSYMTAMDTSPLPSLLPTELTLNLTLSTASSAPSPSFSPAERQTVPRGQGDLPLSLHAEQQRQQQHLMPDDRGVHLVQLLLACANYAAAVDLPRADNCLQIITALSSPSGDTMQRLSSRFAAALAARLLRLRWPGILSALDIRCPTPYEGGDRAARLAFARALPYIPFSRAISVGTVLHSLAHESAVHVVGLGWHRDPSLLAEIIRGFSRMQNRGPASLRLTLVGSEDRSAMLKEANLVDLPFRLDAVSVPLPELNASMLNADDGEALAVVSVLGLHELLAESDGADRFLCALRGMSPAAVVATEQEADLNAGSVTERFEEGLHHYGALFDSVDAAAAAGRLRPAERTAVEEMLGREVENAVAREGRERVVRHERVERWARRFARAGFRPAVPLDGVVDEAQRVVDSFRADGVRGYDIAAQGGRAAICWHRRPMYTVSAWHC